MNVFKFFRNCLLEEIKKEHSWSFVPQLNFTWYSIQQLDFLVLLESVTLWITAWKKNTSAVCFSTLFVIKILHKTGKFVSIQFLYYRHIDKKYQSKNLCTWSIEFFHKTINFGPHETEPLLLLLGRRKFVSWFSYLIHCKINVWAIQFQFLFM